MQPTPTRPCYLHLPREAAEGWQRLRAKTKPPRIPEMHHQVCGRQPHWAQAPARATQPTNCWCAAFGLEIKQAGAMGWGVFALTAFTASQFICPYAHVEGEKISHADFVKVQLAGLVCPRANCCRLPHA